MDETIIARGAEGRPRCIPCYMSGRMTGTRMNQGSCTDYVFKAAIWRNSKCHVDCMVKAEAVGVVHDTIRFHIPDGLQSFCCLALNSM